MHNPISKRSIDFSRSEEYRFRTDLIEAPKRKRKVALRIGTLKASNEWCLYPRVLKALLSGDKSLSELSDKDVYPEVRQKGIDMKIGVDIASLALKKFVDTIVLFSGDSDFVPAAKLARREGIDFILDPMKANVDPQLFEHIDGMKHCQPKIVKGATTNNGPAAPVADLNEKKGAPGGLCRGREVWPGTCVCGRGKQKKEPPGGKVSSRQKGGSRGAVKLARA